MRSAINKFSSLFLLLILFSLFVSGCNSDSSEPTESSNDDTGSVAILLTDAPIDNFDRFMLTVSEISLLGDEGAVVLFRGSETLDLLNLQSHADLFSLSDGVPAGNYYKIRMQISDPQLIRLGLNGAIEEIVEPKMGGNGKLDLNPRADIVVVAGETVALQVDLDVGKSIHVVQNGNHAYRFRPVIFVDILTYGVNGKLVRISGSVSDKSDEGFELCSGDDETRFNDDHCVYVYTGEQTVYFDETGGVVNSPSLQEEDTITVLGYYRNREDRHVGLDAEIIEMAAGDVYQSFYGIVDSMDVSNRQLVLRDKQGLLTSIMFYPESKLFSMSGTPMTLDDLYVDANVKIEGVYIEGESLVKAAAIFIESPVEIAESLAGNILRLHEDLSGFDMTDDALGDVCVALDENTDIYLLTIEDGHFSSEEVGISALQAGQHLEVYGSFNLGCFVAENILLERLD